MCVFQKGSAERQVSENLHFFVRDTVVMWPYVSKMLGINFALPPH